MPGARASTSIVIALAAAAAAASGCKPELSYAEPDLGPSRAAFRCAQSPRGEAADACRMLAAFDQAQMVSTWPAEGRHSWWGRMHCSDTLDRDKAMTFGWVHLMPGPGDFPSVDGVKHDPARTLAHHGSFPSMTVAEATPGRLEVHRRLLKAIAAGAQPDLSGLEPADVATARRTWASLHTDPAASPPKVRLTRSATGRTVLGNNARVGNDQGFVTYYNLRQQGTRLYLLKPGKDVHCIAELYRAFRPAS